MIASDDLRTIQIWEFQLGKGGRRLLFKLHLSRPCNVFLSLLRRSAKTLDQWHMALSDNIVQYCDTFGSVFYLRGDDVRQQAFYVRMGSCRENAYINNQL